MRLWAMTADAVDRYVSREKSNQIRAEVEVATGSAAPTGMAGSVALVRVRGVLEARCPWWSDGTDYEDIVEAVYRAAMSSPAAIVLWVSSPGGAFPLSIETHKRLLTFRAEFPAIPLLGHVDEVGASAAYGLLSACEYISASPTAMIGSVGVRAERVDMTRQLNNNGVDVTIVATGAAKADGDPAHPLKPDELARLQQHVEQATVLFIDAIEAARPALAGKLRGLEAQTFFAAEALEVGLIDEVATIEQVISTITGRE